MKVWQDRKKTEFIDALCRLTPRRRFELLRLDNICREHDGTFSTAELEAGTVPDRSFRSFFMYYDGKTLVGELFLFITADDNRETSGGEEKDDSEQGGLCAEITAIVDPYWRRKGIFKRMLKAAKAELKKYRIKEYRFVAEPDCADTAEAAKHMGLKTIGSELMMELKSETKENTDNKTKDGETEESRVHINENADGNKGLTVSLELDDGTRIGSAFCYLMNEYAFIGRVEIAEEYRNRGYGKRLMTAVIDTVNRRMPEAVIRLQVFSDNIPAVGLYEKLGFITISRLDYLALPENAK